MIEIAVNIESLSHAQVVSLYHNEQKKNQELTLKNQELSFKYEKAAHELAQLKKLVFGSKHERFIPSAHPEQLQLELNLEKKETPEVTGRTITYTREEIKPPKKESRSRMDLPAHLPREVHIIEPTEDVSGMIKIGEEITEVLEIKPGYPYVMRFVRPKFVRTEPQEGLPTVVIGQLPARIIDKGIAGPGTLAQVMIDKYVDHLPLYRQLERFKRMGVPINMSTIAGWTKRCCVELTPLYELLKKEMLKNGYLQVDETHINVLDKTKKGKTHLGYYWVYRSPDTGLVFFDYTPGRSARGPTGILTDFKGYLQTDGYEVYEQFGQRSDVIHVGCMAHARRKFTEALSNDEDRAKEALAQIQKLYALERTADMEGFSIDQRKEIREAQGIPILQALYEWMVEQYRQVPPRSAIGIALFYSLQRWEKLTQYVKNGRLKIDNNLVENAIRPVALGRKNYLFAGSHEAAQRGAMIYSLLSTCKAHQVNPYEWLRDVFTRLPDHPINRIEELLPQQWSKINSDSKKS